MPAIEVRGDGNRAAAPAVVVLATGRTATTRALHAAAARARDAAGSIVLLVPHPTSYRTGTPDDAMIRLADTYRDLAARVGVNAFVRVCVCRQVHDIFRQLVRQTSTVVIAGGRGPRFWPTAERRLARALARDGFDVVFEEV
jgi:nucleotide-binding universal stress UspA family protein